MQSKLFALVSVAALGGMLVTGCSKSADSSSSTDSSATSAPAAAASSDASATQTVASAGDAAKGEAIFTTNCVSCHGAKGAGGMGPSLKGEKARKDTAAAIAWIKNPQPPMPKLYPSPLSEKDVADVAAYVESL